MVVEQKNRQYSFFIYCISMIITLLFAIQYKTNSMIFGALGAILLFLSAILFDTKNYLILVVTLIPGVGYIKLLGYQFALVGYSLILSTIKYFLKKQKNVFISIPLFLHIVCIAITVIFYSDISLLTSAIRSCVFFVFITTYWHNEVTEIEYRKQYCLIILKAFLIGVLLNIVLGIIFNPTTVFSGYFSGIKNDRNYYSSIISVCLCTTSALLMTEKKYLLYIASLAVLFFGGILSGSRTFLVSCVWVLLLFFTKMIDKKYRRAVIISVILAGILFIILWPNLQRPISLVLSRFDSSDAINGNGRYDAWKYYLRETFNSVFSAAFGRGNSIAWFGGSIVQHNTLIQAISEVGVFGTVTLLFEYLAIFKIIKPNARIKISNLFPFCSFIMCYSFINALYSDIFNLLFFVCCVCYYLLSIENFEICVGDRCDIENDSIRIEDQLMY